MYFRNYTLSNTWLEHSSKSAVSKTSFQSQHVKGSQTLVKTESEAFDHILHHSEKAQFGKYLPY